VGLGRTIWVRPDLKKRKGYVGPRSAQPKVPGLGPVSWAGPAHVCVYIYIYIIKNNTIILKKTKNFKKISKILSKKIVIFSNIFLPTLHNIGLYIYTVKYKFGIKISGFLQNISKKNKNNNIYFLK
jgi:hypothetical protein